MNPETLGVIQLLVLTLAIFIGFPTAFTLLGLGLVFGTLGIGWGPELFNLMAIRTFQVMTNDVLISIVLFVFMGYVLERSGVMDRLFHAILVASGPLPGSLALATVITCTIFAMATGIIGASVTIMGLLALPPMLRLRYDKRLATGSVAAGGTLGILIPPSVLLILYAANAGISIVKLYLAAFIPGFLLAGLYVLYILVRALLRPDLSPPLPKEERNYTVPQILGMLATGVLPISLLILAVLGSIVAGLAAPTEAAAMGALGALALSAAYRRLTWQALRESVYHSLRTSSTVLFLFVGSNIFSAVFARLGGFAGHRTVHYRPRTHRAPVPVADADRSVPPGLAPGVDGDHHHLHAALLAAGPGVRDRPHLAGRTGGGEPPDRLSEPAGGHGRLLHQGGGPAGRPPVRHLVGDDALPGSAAGGVAARVLLPATGPVAAQRPDPVAVGYCPPTSPCTSTGSRTGTGPCAAGRAGASRRNTAACSGGTTLM